MNDSTSEALIVTARQMFAKQGFKGTTVRAMTTAAGANLGAITYHFGSKRALYHAVLQRVMGPFRERVAAMARGSEPALVRIERVVRCLFDHTAQHPDLPRLLLQQLATDEPFPAVARETMHANVGVVVGLIREGQREGTIRRGDPRFMALSIGAQPIFLALLRAPLREALEVDQNDPTIRGALVESVVDFVRAALRPAGRDER